MKASKRVENLLPSGILVVGLAAMALFGVGFSAFQTSNTMSPIENSIDVEVGSIIEGGKTVLEITGTTGFGKEFGPNGFVNDSGAFDGASPAMTVSFKVYHAAADESGYVSSENKFKMNATLYSDEIDKNFFLYNLKASCNVTGATIGSFTASGTKAKQTYMIPLTSGAPSTSFTLTYTLTEDTTHKLDAYYDKPFTVHYAVEGVKA